MRLFQLLLVCIFIISFLGSCSKKANDSQEEKLTRSMLPKDGLSSGDSSSFEQEFVSQFRAGSLPYETSLSYTIDDTIPAEFVIQNIFEAAKTSEVSLFNIFWGDEETQKITRQGLENRYINVDKNAFNALNFGFLHRVNLHSNYYSLIFQCIPSFMEGSYKYTYLANYTNDGKLIDALQIGGLAGYVDIQQKWQGSINEAREVKVENTTISDAEAFNKEKDFVEKSTLVYQILENGKFEMKDQQYSSFSGDFQSVEGKEFFKIEEFFDEIIISYSQNPETEATEALEIINIDQKNKQITAQLPHSTKHVILQFDKHKTNLVRKDEQGETQKYRRRLD